MKRQSKQRVCVKNFRFWDEMVAPRPRHVVMTTAALAYNYLPSTATVGSFVWERVKGVGRSEAQKPVNQAWEATKTYFGVGKKADPHAGEKTESKADANFTKTEAPKASVVHVHHSSSAGRGGGGGGGGGGVVLQEDVSVPWWAIGFVALLISTIRS